MLVATLSGEVGSEGGLKKLPHSLSQPCLGLGVGLWQEGVGLGLESWSLSLVWPSSHSFSLTVWT